MVVIAEQFRETEDDGQIKITVIRVHEGDSLISLCKILATLPEGSEIRELLGYNHGATCELVIQSPIPLVTTKETTG